MGRRSAAPAPATADRDESTTEARKVPLVFCELEGGIGVSLEWERDPSETQIVVAGRRAARHLGCPVPDANAGEAFHDPFR